MKTVALVLVICGSRNRAGKTARVVNALADGVADTGGTCKVLWLPELDVQRCRQCNADGWGICWTKHRCVIKDDFARIIAQMKKASALVFATPVYFGDMSESLKAFLDRLRRCGWKSPGVVGTSGKPAIGICVAGGGGGGAPACAVRMEEVLRFCGCTPVDYVAVRRQNLDNKCRVLRETGRWLVTANHDSEG